MKYETCNSHSSGHINQYCHFIAENPPTSFNPESVCPRIDNSAFVGPFSSVIGDVRIEKEVFIACNVSIRADEGTPFYIGRKTNIQDGVILHGLKESRFKVDNKYYSIYIGAEVSIAHGAVVHGPCVIEDQCFVGFNAIVFNAFIGKGCYIDLGAIVTGGIEIPANRYVPIGAIVNTQREADALPCVEESQAEFSKNVIKVNVELAKSYAFKFGDTHCSCGLCCDSRTLPK